MIQRIFDNYIGPTIGLTVGAVGRFGVAENVSVRPAVGFLTYGSNTGVLGGATVTYDWHFGQWTPYIGPGVVIGASGTGYSGFGIGYAAGVDYKVSDAGYLNIGANAGGGGLSYGFKF